RTTDSATVGAAEIRRARRGWRAATQPRAGGPRRARARMARALGLTAWATALRSLPWLGLARLADFRVDFREGRVTESSRAAVIPSVRARELRRAVWPPPARRWLALVPVAAVSTKASRRRRSGRSSALANASAPWPTRRPISDSSAAAPSPAAAGSLRATR